MIKQSVRFVVLRCYSKVRSLCYQRNSFSLLVLGCAILLNAIYPKRSNTVICSGLLAVTAIACELFNHYGFDRYTMLKLLKVPNDL